MITKNNDQENTTVTKMKEKGMSIGVDGWIRTQIFDTSSDTLMLIVLIFDNLSTHKRRKKE